MITNILNYKNDFRLFINKVNKYILLFNEVLKTYIKFRILLNNPNIKVNLKKYRNYYYI